MGSEIEPGHDCSCLVPEARQRVSSRSRQGDPLLECGGDGLLLCKLIVWIVENEESHFYAMYLPEHSIPFTGALLINKFNGIAHLIGQLSIVLQHLLLHWAPDLFVFL